MDSWSHFRKGKLSVDRNFSKRVITLMVMCLTAIVVLTISLATHFTPANAKAVLAVPLCGDGSAPDYGFSYDLQQSHWTVGWQDYASRQGVTEVDTVFDRLNADSIAQTMILILPQEQVGNRVNCAVHFLRYMKLGLSTGERKDNGVVFLIVVEPTTIDVHYGVGLGLPDLTASDLTALNRAAEDAYQPDHSMDQALLALAQGFDTVARSKYAPLTSLTPPPGRNNQPQSSGPQDTFTIVAQMCFGVLVLLLLIIGGPFLGRGIPFDSYGFGSGSRGGRFGGGRRGGGSGRSGRGN